MVDMKAPWMRIAQALKGEAEIPGAVANPKIVEMFKIASSEFAAMVLDHTKHTTGRTLPNDDNPIRERLRDLGTEERSRFLGLLFKDILDEFAALIVERAKH